MKIKAIALAVAALTAGAANAYTDDATNIYLTGASAIRNNVAAAVKAMCADASGTLTVYKNGTSTSSLANQMAYVCSAGMAGTGITTVFHTVTGGSLNSILGMSADVGKQQQPMSFTGCTAPVAGTGALAGYTVRPGCGLDAKAASDGGFSDVEYGPAVEQVNILNTATDGFDLSGVVPGFTGVAQVFGIAVSKKMYEDLQTAQGLIGKSFAQDNNDDGDTLDAGETGICALSSAEMDCQPSLSRSDVASMMNNNTFAPQKNGAEALGLTVGASVEYARRPATSGTQTSAQVYFLGKGCLNGDNGGQFDIIGAGSYNGGKFTVTENSGTGDVITRLKTADYVFGAVSLENRPVIGTDTWRFVKVSNNAGTEGTNTGLNKKTAIAGTYDYFVEAAAYSGPGTDANEAAVLLEITNKMGLPVSEGGANTIGLFIIPENNGGYDNATYPAEVGKYQRGGSTPNSCQPVSRPF